METVVIVWLYACGMLVMWAVTVATPEVKFPNAAILLWPMFAMTLAAKFVLRKIKAEH